MLLASPAWATDWWITGIPSPNASSNRFAGPMSPMSASTEGIAQMFAPFAVTATDINCLALSAPGTGGSGKKFTMALRVAGASSALTCDISETATTCSATASVSIAAGDLINLASIPASTPTTSELRCGISVN